jgi:2,4-dienoyl-CoA reductase-like NADH-dependent reductase (Old Yellow Enzyme family)
MDSVTRLFETTSIGGMKLRNRVIRSATLENMATAEGLPTDKTGRLYERLARGGAGLIITGYAYVDGAGRTYPRQNGAHTDAAVSRWRPITDAVHAHGARIAMQIVHGGRQVKPYPGRGRPLAPSASPNLVDFTLARSMTADEIRRTIEDFGRAAARVKAAGFDAVQIHAAHGYLLSSFLSPLTNRRRDEWGGDDRRRLAFPLAVYRAVREAVGADFISMARPLIREPGLPGKWERGDSREARCTSCNLCLGEIDRGGPLRCYAAKSSKSEKGS